MKNIPDLTKSTAKQHCRTCLIKINLEEGDIVDIAKNTELKALLSTFLGSLCDLVEIKYAADYPKNICLGCFNKLQQIDSFVHEVRKSSDKLLSVFDNEVLNKEGTNCDNWNDGESSRDIYKLLLKDTLMETESVLLDSGATSVVVETEINNSDPFSNNTEAVTKNNSLLSNINSEEESDDEQEFMSDYSNNESCNRLEKGNTRILKSDESSKNGLEENLNCSNSPSNTESEKPSTRLRVKVGHKIGEIVRKKKKRCTKKEIELLRIKQLEHEDKLNNKRRQKGTKNNFKCTQCNHCFAHKFTLDAHIRKVHEGNKRPFRCDRCDKSYSFIGGLYTHIKEIHEAEVRSYACDFPNCERIYTSFIAMQKHKRLKHTGGTGEQKKYVCEQCGATFNQTGNLKYHRRTKHPTEEEEKAEKEREKERYECEICKKLFHSQYTLKYHTIQLHTNETKYECNVCGRKTAKKFMLVQHMLVHSTEKMPCEHCGKQFIRKFELEAHIKAVHMKLKPFECQYCSECFASRKTLRHHEYIHTGEKPYVCDCGQAFRQQTCLKNHRKSHEKVGTNEAPSKPNLSLSCISSTPGSGSQQETMSTNMDSTATVP